MTEGAIYKKIVRRGITLVFLGLVYNGLLSFEFDHLRCASVLARIGLGWMFAALLFVRFGWKVRAGITVLILVGYWLRWLLCLCRTPVERGHSPRGKLGRVY